jgi:hypothetical protein
MFDVVKIDSKRLFLKIFHKQVAQVFDCVSLCKEVCVQLVLVKVSYFVKNMNEFGQFPLDIVGKVLDVIFPVAFQ